MITIKNRNNIGNNKSIDIVRHVEINARCDNLFSTKLSEISI